MKLRRAADEYGRVDGSGERRTEFKWAEAIGPPECPLMIRWCALTKIGSLRLHHFLRSDMERDAHDHPWWFVTLILKGGYTDYRLCDDCLGISGEGSGPFGYCETCYGIGHLRDRLRPGSIRFRSATHRHWVHTENSWSLVLTGPVSRQWGFWDHGVFRRVVDYFDRYGYSPCQD